MLIAIVLFCRKIYFSLKKSTSVTIKPLNYVVANSFFEFIQILPEIYKDGIVCGALHDLVPLVKFKKRKKHPWRSATFSCRLKPATLLKVALIHGFFSHFLNCAHGTKSRNAPHVYYICNNMCME